MADQQDALDSLLQSLKPAAPPPVSGTGAPDELDDLFAGLKPKAAAPQQQGIPGMEKLGGVPPGPPEAPVTRITRETMQGHLKESVPAAIQAIRNEEEPGREEKLAEATKRFGSAGAGLMPGTQGGAEVLTSLIPAAADTLAGAAAGAESAGARQGLKALSGIASGYFALQAGKGALDEAAEATKARQQGDWLGWVRHMGTAGLQELIGYMGTKSAIEEYQGVANIAKAKNLLQDELNRRAAAESAAEKMAKNPPRIEKPPVGLPAPGEAAAPETPPAPESAPPAPEVKLPTLRKGAAFDTPEGKYTVVSKSGDKVLYTLVGPDGKRSSGFKPIEEFRGMVMPAPEKAGPPEVQGPPEAAAAPESATAATPGDDVYAQAVALVRQAGKASTSTLQRNLRLGYGAASQMLDRMEKDGIVGPANGSAPREVLPEGTPPPAAQPQNQPDPLDNLIADLKQPVTVSSPAPQVPTTEEVPAVAAPTPPQQIPPMALARLRNLYDIRQAFYDKPELTKRDHDELDKLNETIHGLEKAHGAAVQDRQPSEPLPADFGARAEEAGVPIEGLPASPVSLSAPEPEPHKFSSTQVNLPTHVASGIHMAAAQIPDSQLAEDGRETEPHITVKYRAGDDPAEIQKLLADEPPVRATLGKASLFSNDDADVLKVGVDSPDLHRLNAKIAEKFKHPDDYPEYKPHVTIAYLKPGEGKQYEGKVIPGVTGQEVTLPSVTFSGKDRVHTEIPLTGKVKPEDSASSAQAGMADTSLDHIGRLLREAATKEAPTPPTQHEALLARAKVHNELENVETQLKNVGALRPQNVDAERVRLGQERQRLEAKLAEAQRHVDNSKFTPEQQKTFHDTYEAELQKFAEPREKHYPAALLMSNWDELQAKEAVEVPSLTKPGQFSNIFTGKRWEGLGKKRKQVKFYEVKTAEGPAYTFDWEGPTENDWAGARALTRARGGPGGVFANESAVHAAMMHDGDYTGYHEKQYALEQALKAVMPDAKIPSFSTVTKAPKNPTIQDALNAVADTLRRNISPSYGENQEEAIQKAEKEIALAKPIIGEQHPRVQELQKLVDEQKAELTKKATAKSEFEARQNALERERSEAGARKDAAYYARFGSTGALPAIEKYGKLAGWTEKGEALNERALKEFGIEKNQLQPGDISGIKLKKADLDLLRDAKLDPDGTMIPGRLSQGTEAEWKARGWLDENGIRFTEAGERAALALRAQDAADEAGRPISEYKPGNGRVSAEVSRFNFNLPIPLKGDVWHTNGHFLVLGPPPKYWPTEPDKEKKGPDISRVIPDKAGAKIKPVGFYTPQWGRAIAFSNGQVVTAEYFDYINKLHSPDKWTSVNGKDAIQAWKDGKRVAVLMPRRADTLPPNIQKLLPAEKTGGAPSASAPAAAAPTIKGGSDLAVQPTVSGLFKSWGDKLRKKYGFDLPASTYTSFDPIAALKNYTARELSQLEKADPEAYREVRKAIGSRGQSNVLIRAVVPKIKEALKGSGVSWEMFRAAILESRLMGARQRWNDLADAAEMRDMDEAVEAYNGGLSSLLDALEGRRGMDDFLRQDADAMLANEDINALNEFLAENFRNAAAHVGTMRMVMGPGGFEGITQNPGFQKALEIYKSELERPLAENHASNEGIFSDALGPLDTYYPAIPLAEDERARFFGPRATPYRKPANAANAFFTGLGEYTLGMDAFHERISQAIRANNKAAMLQALEDHGLIVPIEPGAQPPTMELPDGRRIPVFSMDGKDYPAEVKQTSQPKTIIQNGKLVRVAGRNDLIPNWLAKELEPFLEPGVNISRIPTAAKRVINALNSIALQGPLDLVFHATNILGTMAFKTPFAGTGILSKTIGNTPVTKIFTGIVNAMHQNPDTPESIRKLYHMAKLGLVPGRFGSETFSRQIAEETGAELRRATMGPILFGPHGFDIRTRLLMYDIAHEINPNVTDQELIEFMRTLGEYNREFEGRIERAIKDMGIAPFATAGTTMYRNSIAAWIGGGQMPKAAPWTGRGAVFEPYFPRNAALKMARLLSAGAIGLLAMWMVANKVMNGKWTGDQFLKSRVPDSWRHSKAGRAIWGKSGKPGYLNWAFFSPLVDRGGRTLGIGGTYNTLYAGGTFGQGIESAQKDMLNSVGHPLTSGPLFKAGFIGLFGREPYISGLRDRSGQFGPNFRPGIARLPAGLPTIGARAGEALLNVNSFYQNAAAVFGLGEKSANAEDGTERWLRTVTDVLAPRFLGQTYDVEATRKALRQQARAASHPVKKR